MLSPPWVQRGKEKKSPQWSLRQRFHVPILRRAICIDYYYVVILLKKNKMMGMININVVIITEIPVLATYYYLKNITTT